MPVTLLSKENTHEVLTALNYFRGSANSDVDLYLEQASRRAALRSDMERLFTVSPVTVNETFPGFPADDADHDMAVPVPVGVVSKARADARILFTAADKSNSGVQHKYGKRVAYLTPNELRAITAAGPVMEAMNNTWARFLNDHKSVPVDGTPKWGIALNAAAVRATRSCFVNEVTAAGVTCFERKVRFGVNEHPLEHVCEVVMIVRLLAEDEKEITVRLSSELGNGAVFQAFTEHKGKGFVHPVVRKSAGLDVTGFTVYATPGRRPRE
jgi:hypothetical protein